VLGLLLKGYSNKEIARQLNLSPHTVKIHVSALLRCFAVQKRSSLAVAAAALHADGIGHCSPLGSFQMLQISA
jgi:DNA-binding NarL/FixJ family response regulator